MALASHGGLQRHSPNHPARQRLMYTTPPKQLLQPAQHHTLQLLDACIASTWEHGTIARSMPHATSNTTSLSCSTAARHNACRLSRQPHHTHHTHTTRSASSPPRRPATPNMSTGLTSLKWSATPEVRTHCALYTQCQVQQNGEEAPAQLHVRGSEESMTDRTTQDSGLSGCSRVPNKPK